MTQLLAPAGDENSAYAALLAGADAVYLGLTQFSARAGAENFSVQALARVTRFAHLLGAKVYVALNTLVRTQETGGFFDAVRAAWDAGADAVLMQDIFLGRAVKEAYPEIVLHLSTQAGCCNTDGALVAKEYGFSRVVLARETPVCDIAAISAIVETEAFVQGALCTCFSGQCYLSSFAGNNSGNRGRCKQPCRKRYTIDRRGFETPAYALSLSDLSLGGDVKRLVEAGVSSLKIEGRMRSPAYAAAAVKYYKAVLAGKAGREEFSDLARAYNRGGYTRGIGFGQDASLLSRAVQGHVGERVGCIVRAGKTPVCGSAFSPQKGDAFKILRGGKEVGGGVYASACKEGFTIAASARLSEGDEVHITTDTAAAARALIPVASRPVRIRVTMRAGEAMRAECEGFVFTGGMCEAAKNAPLTRAEIEANFMKTDGLPLSPAVEAVTDGVFVPKSVLNAFRRDFYGALAAHLAHDRPPLAKKEIPMPAVSGKRGSMSAVIVAEGAPMPEADMVIWKPRDYADMHPPAGTWLYLPPLLTAADAACILPQIPLFEGIYGEGTYAIAFAEKYGVKLFAGVGWNVTNAYAAAGALAAADYITLSKEISRTEQKAICSERTFALSGGDIKVMDLCYCPFGRTCAACDKRGVYTLTDEAGRRFPLRRYRAAEGCRFELYNCAALAAEGGACPLRDASLGERGAKETTRGHSERSML